jgi:hypothetical protein
VALSGDGAPQATMGIGVGDVDGNGLVDLFTTNFSSDTNTLLLQGDGGVFADRTRSMGLAAASWAYVGWACAFDDFDTDGDEDLLVFNGHVYPQAAHGELDGPYEQPPLLFERLETGFRRIERGAAGACLGTAYRARSAAFGDLDGDGDTDIVLGELNGPLRIFENVSPGSEARGWLLVALEDARPGAANHRGLGSRVEVTAGGLNGRQVRWIHGGGSFQAASPPVARFGFASKIARVAVSVRWTDGFEQRLEEVEPDRRVVVRRER